MVLKGVFAAVLCAAFLVAGSTRADEYRPDEFLTLDLSKAVLSPKPLGPAAQFEPMRVEAKTDAPAEAVHVEAAPIQVHAVRKHVDAPPKHVNAAPVHVSAAPKHVNAAPVHVNAAPKHVNAAPKAAKIKVAHARVEKPRAPARPELARRHTNPLDAQASDTRIQVWPCRSGGICNWQRGAH
jgi:hypothetical protein